MNAKEALISELLPGEEVFWSEFPGWRSIVTAQSIVATIVFSGFMMFMCFAVKMNGALTAFGPLWAAMLITAAIVRLREKTGVLYAITNKRVLKVSASIFGQSVESIYGWSFRFIRKEKDRFGRGALIFSEKPGSRSGVIRVGLDHIRDVDGAEKWAIRLAEHEASKKIGRADA